MCVNQPYTFNFKQSLGFDSVATFITHSNCEMCGDPKKNGDRKGDTLIPNSLQNPVNISFPGLEKSTCVGNTFTAV